jgi:hypothetical protein
MPGHKRILPACYHIYVFCPAHTPASGIIKLPWFQVMAGWWRGLRVLAAGRRSGEFMGGSRLRVIWI